MMNPDNNDDFAIRVTNISKTFKLPHEKTSSVKSAIVNSWRKRRTFEVQEVLKDINFEIKPGEFFGIVGRNGSGKSTLLKLLAGIYTPTTGSVEINGKLTPFIELGVGFNPELTGRENVFLNGALLGFDRKTIAAMYDDIVEFAELEQFMDQKLKNYSSGMQVRLAFSIAIRAESDMLLIDEVLAVGDQSFQEKCFKYFSEIKKSDKTVIFVTHDMSNVERFCDRVLVIDKKREKIGVYDIPQAVTIYNKLNHEAPKKVAGQKERDLSDKDIFIKKVSLLDGAGKAQKDFKQGGELTIKIDVGLKKGFKTKDMPIVLGLAFYDLENSNLAGPNSNKQKFVLGNQGGSYSFKLKEIPFNMGQYRLTVALFDEYVSNQLDLIDRGIELFVNTDEVHHGKVVLDGTWQKES